MAALERGGRLVGFDQEWKPDRCVQQNHKVALLQFAVADTVFLVRTSRLQFQLPAFLRRVLMDPSIVKIAIDFDGADRDKMKHSFKLSLPVNSEECGILDLSLLAKDCGFQESGLKKLSARSGYRLEKNKKMSVSDWEAAALSEGQLRYARDDAYFPLLIAARLLREAAQRRPPTPLQARTLAGWTAEVEEAALAALESVDTSAQDALQEVLVEELRSLLLQRSAENGKPWMMFSQLQQLEPVARMRRAGLFTGKKFFMELKDDLVVSTRQGADFVRGRSDWERAPAPEGALALPWAEDPQAALTAWAELERAGDPTGTPLSNWEAQTLRYRLGKVARALEEREEGPAATAVRGLSGNAQRLLCDVGAVEAAGAGAPPLAEGSGCDRPAERQPCSREQQQQPREQGQQQSQPAERMVFVKLLSRGVQLEALSSELADALGLDVFEDVVSAPVKSRSRGVAWALVALRTAAAVAELLDRTGFSEESPGRLQLASGDAQVCRYRGHS